MVFECFKLFVDFKVKRKKERKKKRKKEKKKERKKESKQENGETQKNLAEISNILKVIGVRNENFLVKNLEISRKMQNAVKQEINY